ncbi:hypothetical protein Ddye_005575 [Dipteronia dyeriana]|uniref:Uncharacterized protein n=1 Tax=Dipteronia dyeriana TaxID=168575 RepID=A0AAD9XGW8_9ROSI|nr:hypothetical protein Ddye_005575 [Dipteronia dyeriana]
MSRMMKEMQSVKDLVKTLNKYDAQVNLVMRDSMMGEGQCEQEEAQRILGIDASLRRIETQLTQIAESILKQEKGKSVSVNEHAKVMEVAHGGEIIPSKLKDPGSFIIPVRIRDSSIIEIVLDMAASNNMMPLQVCRPLKIDFIKPASITLKMVVNSTQVPVGVTKDVQLDVHGLKVPVDFVILEVKEKGIKDRDWKLLLGRSFMATAGMIVNVVSRHLSLCCGGKRVEFIANGPEQRKMNEGD